MRKFQSNSHDTIIRNDEINLIIFQYVTVTLCETGRFLGRIEQEFSWDETVLKIFDEIGKNVMIVTGKLVDGTEKI